MLMVVMVTFQTRGKIRGVDTAEKNADNMTNNYNVLKYTCYGKEL